MSMPSSGVLIDSEYLTDGTESAGGGGNTIGVLNTRPRRLSRSILTVVGAIAIVTVTLSATWFFVVAPKPEVTIVAILPLSGASSYLVEIEDAMVLATEKINRWGGINGANVRLVVEDCSSVPEVAVAKFIETEEKYNPLAVVTATRASAFDMADIAEEHGTVLISIGATAENLTYGRDWVFRYYVTPSGEADTASSMLETLNVSSLGILHLDDVYGNPVKTQVSEAFQETGGTVEARGFLPNRTDFSELVADITDNEAIFVVALRHQYPMVFEELNASGYQGHVLAGVEASIPEFWAMPDEQGVLMSAPIMYSEGAAIDTNFLIEFEDRFGRPLTHQGAIGADAIRLIWGLLSDTEVSAENLRALMDAGFTYSGILGVVSMDQGIHNADISVFPAVVEGGELRYL